MIKTFLLLILTITFASCQSDKDVAYADKLKNCLPENDVKILNHATKFFENKLIERYGNENINENYLAYLTDMSQPKFAPEFPKEFFITVKSKQILNDLVNNANSASIWIPYIENEDTQLISIIENDKSERENFKLDYLNPNGGYLNCIVKENDTKIMNDVLTRMAEIGRLSPTFTSGALKNNLQASDFDNDLNKVAVAIGFYYDIVKMVVDNKK